MSNADLASYSQHPTGMAESISTNVCTPTRLVQNVLNHSNVQIVCRINAPQKTTATQHHKVSSLRKSNSAQKISFTPSNICGYSQRNNGAPLRSSSYSIFSTHTKSTPSLYYPLRQESLERFKPNAKKSLSPDRNQRIIRVRSKEVRQKSKSGTRNNSVGLKKPNELFSRHSSPSVFHSNKVGVLSRDAKYSVFTTLERSNKVVLSETPISGRILNEQLGETKDLQHFLSSCQQNGYENQVFEFDGVFNEMQKQEKFYSAAAKPLVQGFFEGENGTVLAFGPTQSGKTYTMHGKIGVQRGIIPRAVEDILSIIKASYDFSIQSSSIEELGSLTNPIVSVNSRRQYQSRENGLVTTHMKGAPDPDIFNERVFLRMSVYMIYCDNIYDLLAKSPKRVKQEQFIDRQSQEVVSRFVNLSEKLILTLEQYYQAIQEAFKERRSISVKMQDHDIRKRSHIIVSLSLVQQNSGQHLPNSVQELSRLNFVELSGSEQSVASSGQQRDTTVRQFVTKSFNCLSTQLLKSALGKRTQFEEGDSSLVACLKSTLTQKSTILVVQCASPNQQFFDHTLPAVKFCSKIRETIIRKMQKLMLIKRSQASIASNQQLRFKEGTKLNSEAKSHQKQTTFGAPGSQLQESLQASIDFDKARDNPQSIIDQLEIEVQINEAKLRDVPGGSRGQMEVNAIQRWTARSLDLVNKAIFNLNQSDNREKHSLTDRLYYIKMRITEIEQKVNTPKTSLSPRIANRGMESPAVFHQGSANLKEDVAEATYHAGSFTDRHNDTRRDPFNNIVVSARSNRIRSTREQIISPLSVEPIIPTDLNLQQYKTVDQRLFSRNDNVGKFAEPLSARNGTNPHYFSVRDNRKASHSGSRSPESHQHALTAREPYNESKREYLIEEQQQDERQRKQLNAQPLPSAIQTYHNDSRPESPSPSFRRKDEAESTYKSQFSQREQRDLRNMNLPQQLHQPSYVRHDFEKAQSLPHLQEIKEKFISSQKIHKIITQALGDPNQPQSMYRSSEETLNDFSRLIMLEDFDGLKRRVMQLYRERQGCGEVIQTRDAEIAELQEQLDARDKVVQEVESINNKNLDEYIRSMQELKNDKEMTETQGTIHMKILQETIDHQTEQLEELKRLKSLQDGKLDQCYTELDTMRRVKFDCEEKTAKFTDENQKLRSNYEVLKEHELNIIKDFQEKKIIDQKALNEQITQLKKVIVDKDAQIRDREVKNNELMDQIKRQQFEQEKVEDSKTILECNQELLKSQLNQSQKDKESLSNRIQMLEDKLNSAKDFGENETKAKQQALEEIDQLQDLISDMEQTIQTLNQDIKTQQATNQQKGSTIDQLNLQKKVYDERMELKEKEIKSILANEAGLSKQFAELERQYEQLEHTHIKFKAQEYDKVDVLKVNAELEGRVSHLQADVEQVVKDRNTLQGRLHESLTENEQLKDQIRMHMTEQEFFRKTNEQQLDKFDQKFTQFQQELTFLNDENIRLKEKEKKQKRLVHEHEVELLAWKEKHKYTEERNRDLNLKLEDVTRDMTHLVHENEKQVMFNMIQEKKGQRKESKNEEAMDDIKMLIKNFKHQRVGQKENTMTANATAAMSDTQRTRDYYEENRSPREFNYKYK